MASGIRIDRRRESEEWTENPPVPPGRAAGGFGGSRRLWNTAPRVCAPRRPDNRPRNQKIPSPQPHMLQEDSLRYWRLWRSEDGPIAHRVRPLWRLKISAHLWCPFHQSIRAADFCAREKSTLADRARNSSSGVDTRQEPSRQAPPVVPSH